MMIAAILLLQGALPTTVGQPPAPSADDAKMVCRTMGTTGSRLGGKRVCATKAEWDRREFNDRQMTELMAEKNISDRGL